MNLDQQQEILKKYLNGTATPEEIKSVESWYQAFDNVPVSIEKRISSLDGELMRSAILKRIRGGKAVQLWKTVVRVAAVFAMLLIGAWYVYQQQYSKKEDLYTFVETEKGERIKVVLPDSSTLWLNEQTIVQYGDHSFGKSGREIWLKKGEAYFDVKPHENLPFIVHSGPLNTTVLGTAFNIKSSEKYQDIQVSVTRGKVQVNHESTKLGQLTKGEQITYNLLNQQYALNTINPAYAIAWQRSDVHLENVSFNELSEAFYSLYNIRLRVEKEAIRNNKYTLTIGKSMPSDMAIEIITAIHQINHKKENGDIILY